MDFKTAVIFICENYIIDIHNKLSIINMIDNWSTDKFPVRLSHWVYSYTNGWAGETKFKITITDPQGTEKIHGSVNVEIPDRKQNQIYLEPLNIELNEYGEYIFRLYINDEHVTEKYLSVIPVVTEE